MALSFSRILAILVGIITLVSEVVRRKQQLLEPASFLLWIDDGLLAGFLLYGAWRSAADPRTGRAVLAGAWGFMCGMAYYSFFGELQQRAAADPSALVPWWVMAVKGVSVVVAIVGMVAAVRPSRSDS